MINSKSKLKNMLRQAMIPGNAPCKCAERHSEGAVDRMWEVLVDPQNRRLVLMELERAGVIRSAGVSVDTTVDL